MTSRQLARLVQDAAVAKKARDVVIIDLRKKSSMADFFVIAEGDTDRQTRAIADGIREAARDKGIRPFHVSGEADGAWILVDFIDVIVHVFLPGERAFYDLESLWQAEPMTELVRTRARAGGG
ncbi:MAG: ribosome-associated protein [Chloroflexota bacterium]|jgi:ribosome-associated protein|nr:ribosome-associated protein [Chloroflexota bacterium]